MKRANSEDDARRARDLSIECMVIFGRTISLVRASCTNAYFRAYLKACAQVMGELADITSRAAYDFPSLKLSESEWKAIEASGTRVTQLPAEGPVDRETVSSVLALARTVFSEIQAIAPRMTGPVGQVEETFALAEEVLSRFSAAAVQ